MPDRHEWDERIAQAKALLAITRQTTAAARNQRHTAVLQRALDKLMRPRTNDQPPTAFGSERKLSSTRARF